MSGFVAIFNANAAPVDREILENLTDSLYFRGPDEQQVWIDGPVGLGHTLFRTTDEANYEKQPATLDNEVWIAGCIRIDARADLIRELGLQREIRLAQTPDSHLVLWAYEAWGEECPERLSGDFSFAIWDRRKQTLFCARDRFGMRQLVYAHQGDTFIVSNSIDCIRRHPLVSSHLCDDAIGDFLLFGDSRWGSRIRTSFSDIEALEPAHCFSVTQRSKRNWRYWEIPTNIPILHYRKNSDYIEHFSDILKVSVNDRIRTRDISIYLSGGMDSSSLAATICALKNEQSQPIDLHAATVIYDSIHPSDEKRFVDEVSAFLNLETLHIDAGMYPLMSRAEPTTFPLELYQPNLWLDLQRYAGQKSRVVLNGDGGDEVMAFTSVRAALQGVHVPAALACIFQLKHKYGLYPPLGFGLKKAANTIFRQSGGLTTPYPYPGWINPELEERLGLKDRWTRLWSTAAENTENHNARIYQGIQTPDWNTDDKYMCSRFTLPEERSPFLDTRLVNFMVSLPALPWLFNKHILRTCMAGQLPVNVLRRPKTPLGFIHDSLIKNTDHSALNDWRPAKGLVDYIELSKLPILRDAAARGAESYVNLRPLMLNRWLKGLE